MTTPKTARSLSQRRLRLQCGSRTTDTFTANVTHAPPMFTQCPPVDESSGCQFLITVTNGGETVVQDPNQGPYEGIEDSLIGVAEQLLHADLRAAAVGTQLGSLRL